MKRFLAMFVAITILLPLFPMNVKAEEIFSGETEAYETLRFDLGGAGVAEGYIGVSAGDAYDVETGYGFANTEAVEDVLAGGEGALADAVRFKSDVANHIFKVDLPSGVYKITVTTGDVESTTITAEGRPQLFFLTGSNAVDSFTIPVTDGQLNIHAGSGVGTEFSISALEIEQTSTGTTTKPTIWVSGDSTVASYYNVAADAKRGWGQYLCNYVDTDKYDIRNLSASGLRSKNVLETFFPVAEYYGKSGDILLLAVGINDYTDEYKLHPDAIDSSGYIANMTEMVQRAKAKGMTVYLVKQQGELNDCKKYPIPTEKWFNDEIDAIAASENIGVIDLFHPWLEFCLEQTSIEARNYYAPGENLHPNALGADKLAQMVNEQLFPAKGQGGSTEDPYKDFDTPSTIYYETEASGEPVANPHKGFVMTVTNPDMLYRGKHPYGIGGEKDNHAWDVVTICSGVMFWEDINPQKGVYNWEEIDDALKACEQAGMTYGIRIIPYTTSTGSDDNYGVEHDFVPQWVYDEGATQKTVTYKYGDPNVQIKVPDWSNEVYIQAYKDFTTALAEKYNGDPRVEYVEIRAFGNMGEWHVSEFEGIEMPSLDIQKDMLNHFASVFDKTTCCLMSDAKGEVYDYALSIGITKRNNGLILTPNEEWDLRPAYKANLPTMADNHNTYEYMLDAEDKLSDEYLKWTPERFRETIEIAHLSIYALDQEGYGSYKFYREQKDVIDEMVNRLGYNFTVTSAKRNENKLLVTVENTGLASAFFNIELCAEITDEKGNKVADFGQPVRIAKGSFRDGTSQTFLFEYDGVPDENARICLAMYDSDNYLATGDNPTVRFDNANTLSNNRLLLTDHVIWEDDEESDEDEDSDEEEETDEWEEVVVPFETLRFDLGGEGVAEGYIGVSAQAGYDASVGYGFTNTNAVEDVLAGGSGALADAVRFKSNVSGHVFNVDLPKGVYKITVTTGDDQSTTIRAEGMSQLFFLTGNNAVDSFTIPVTDGQLNIYAGSGVGEKFSISAIEIEKAGEGTVGKPTIWLAGDETVSKRYNIPEDDGSRRGWGEYLSAYVDMNTYDIRHISAGGITAKAVKDSFLPTAEFYGKKGDILILAVGLNDYAKQNKEHPDSLDPTEYKQNMTEIIRRAKAKGMTVYLVKQSGELHDATRYPVLTEKWFSAAIDEIAVAEKVAVIDLFRPWLEFCMEQTVRVADKYYCVENSYLLNELGADKLAGMVSEQLFPVSKPEEPVQDSYEDFDNPYTVCYETEVAGGPVVNPHKGYVMTVYNPWSFESTNAYGIGGSMNNTAWEMSTICSGEPKWDELNPEEGVYNWESIDSMLEACEKYGYTYGIRILPYSHLSGSHDNYGKDHIFVPDWVFEKGAKMDRATLVSDPSVELDIPKWDDPIYLQACRDFADALAEHYDGDPRVEFIDISVFGNWGEWHTSTFDGNPMPSEEIQKEMIKYYSEAFDKTMLCLTSGAYGDVYDYALSLGVPKRVNGLIATHNYEWNLRPNYYANLPVIGENFLPYKMMLEPDVYAQGIVTDYDKHYLRWTPERFRETIEISHLSIYAFDQDSKHSYEFYKEQKDLIEEMNNRLGYNYTVTSAKRNGNKLLVTIKNTGLAPAFFDIELSAEIIDENGAKLDTFGKPVVIESGSFRDEEEKTFLFEYGGTLGAETRIALAMYDKNNYLVEGKDPTIKFDNKNTLSNNRFLLVENASAKEDPDVAEDIYLIPGNDHIVIAPGETADISFKLQGLDNCDVYLLHSTDEAVVNSESGYIADKNDAMKGIITAGAKEGTAWLTFATDIQGKGSQCAYATVRVDVAEKEEAQKISLGVTSGKLNVYDDSVITVPVYQMDSRYRIISATFVTPQAPEEAAAMNEKFVIRIKNDRTLQVEPRVPADSDAMNWSDWAKSMKGTYKAAIQVNYKEDGYGSTVYHCISPEILTISATATAPAIKAKAVKFNTFYQNQTLDMVYTMKGASISEAKVDLVRTTAKTKACPDWLTLSADGMNAAINSEMLAEMNNKASGKVYLKVWPEGWRAPAQISVSVSAAYSVPKIKLSKKTVTLNSDSNFIDECQISILSGDKKITYKDLNITAIRMSDEADFALMSDKERKKYAATGSLSVSSFDAEEGTFCLDAVKTPVAGKALLILTVGDDSRQEMKLPVNVKVVSKPVLKASTTKVTLNQAYGSDYRTRDEKVVTFSTNTDGYDLNYNNLEYKVTDSTGQTDLGTQLGLAEYDGKVMIYPNKNTVNNQTYKVTVRASGIEKPVIITVVTKSVVPKMKLSKAKVTINKALVLHEGKQTVWITSNDKNYDLKFKVSDVTVINPDGSVMGDGATKDALRFYIGTSGGKKYIDIQKGTNCATGNYTLQVKENLPNGESVIGTIKVIVTEKVPSIKLGVSSVTLYAGMKDSYFDTSAGKMVDYNTAIVPVSGNDILDVNSYQHEVKDSKGVDASNAVNVYKYADRIKVSLTDKAVAGEKYKVTYWANLNEIGSNGNRLMTKKVTFTVKSVGNITVKGKVKGNIDLTRAATSFAEFDLSFTGWSKDNYNGEQRPVLKWQVYAMNGKTPVTEGAIAPNGLVAYGDTDNNATGWFKNVSLEDNPYALALGVNTDDIGWDNNQINPTYKYTCKVWLEIPAEITRDSADTQSAIIEFVPMTFKVVQGKTKFGMNIKQALLSKRDSYARQCFTLQSNDKDKLNVTDIEKLQLQPGGLADALEIVEVPSVDGNTYAIQWKDTDAFTSGVQINSGVKSGTVKVNVFLEGNDSGRNKPNATLKLKVTVK